MGLSTITATAILALGALMTNAQVYTCECDGLDSPVWDDCDTIASTLDASPMWYVAPSDQLPCGILDAPEGTDPDSLNCVISYCKRDGVARGEDILYSDILLWYTSLTSNCKSTPGSPGGKCGPTGPVTSDRKVTVYAQANPHYTGGARRRDVDLFIPVNETLVWAEPPKSEREHARDFPHDISKRQEESPPDSDDSFELFVKSNNVGNPYGGRIKVFGPSPSGSTYTVSSSHSETNSVSSSASLSAGFFDIFEASVSIDVGFEETISETEGFSITVDCPSGQRGVVYWVPLYTAYSGLYQPSSTEADWYVANSGPQTSYKLQCIGE